MKKNNEPVQKSFKQQSPVPFTQYPRSAGVLLHITSLPSPFGVGDFGPQAYTFADFLTRSQQSIWQILPINSSSSSQGFSPYSSNGSFAGNTILISPELLVKDGLLSKEDIQKYTVKGNKKTDYDKAQKAKSFLLDKAFQKFASTSSLHQPFQNFCRQEMYWLDDFALYIVLKKENENKSWNEWDEKFKNRDDKALQMLIEKHKEDIEKAKWQQWIFDKQWRALKEYCNSINIKLFGDIPFYVAYDSADVWVNKALFNLDKNGNMLTEGGAPPDDFNAEGQRWGMPVYCWDVLKKNKYDWWLNRMKKNASLFDLVRLDHFRGFSAYWEMDVKAASAKEGRWMPAPGKDFFTLLQKQLHELPFVAEDLGSIDNPVLQLRDEFKLPGMIIQEVGFGEDMPRSKSILHHHTVNSVVYTGNHDNDTILGWYKSLSLKLKKNVSDYTNKNITKKNVCDIMIRLVYSSVAKLAILPMQDILQLDSDTRMNSVPDGGKSWSWRVSQKSMNKKIEKYLSALAYLYDRMPAK